MIIVFDLDDTLYPEITYVQSGIKAVAETLSAETFLDSRVLYEEALEELNKNGRGEIFDNVLKKYDIYSKKKVQSLVTAYRMHDAKISIDKQTLLTLQTLKKSFPLYLVTDGNKVVQANKIKALGIENLFKKVFITHRYGLGAAKPSLTCFEKLRKAENVAWTKIVYVGDDPNKDFVNLNKVGAHTIRVLSGRFAKINLDSEYEARWRIKNLEELPALLHRIDT